MKLGIEGRDLSWLAQKEISSQVAAGKTSLDLHHTNTHIYPCAQQTSWQPELCSLQQEGIILMKIPPAGFNADVRNSTKD